MSLVAIKSFYRNMRVCMCLEQYINITYPTKSLHFALLSSTSALSFCCK